MTQILAHARFGLRLLRRSPGFTTVAVLALALGIAASTAIFSVVYTTFLEPLPYRDAERLVMLWSDVDGARWSVAPADYEDWKRQATVFDDLNAWAGTEVNLAGDDRPERVSANRATPGFLSMMGYGHPLALGRDFLEEEGIAGNDRVVILTHQLWQQRFAGDPEILGRRIRLDGAPFTVVGVLGAGPADRQQAKLWMPLAFTSEQLNRNDHYLLVMGRLKADATLDQANANLDAIAQGLARAYPASNATKGVSVEPFRNNFLSESTVRGLWLLLGTVMFVLLIACANVANLLLARGTARRRELAVRASLGASRGAIVLQLLTESLVLALAGGALGVVLAMALLDAIVVLMPAFMLPSESDVRLNVPVLLFSLGVSALSGVLFGCAPAWQAGRANPNDALKESGRTLSGGRDRVRRALVVLEFALALTLLTGGGLALGGFVRLASIDPGFATDHLLTFHLPVDDERLDTPDRITAFYQDVAGRLERVPGVRSAAVFSGMPGRGSWRRPFDFASRPAADPARRPDAQFQMVTPGYFRTFGVQLLRGRAFTDQDRAGGLRVAMVNETFVQQYLPGVDPLTERVVLEELIPGERRRGPPVEWQIVGVYRDLRNVGPAQVQRPEIDVPLWQSPWPDMNVAVRTSGDPMAVQQDIAGAIRAIDPDLPMANVRTMEQVLAESMAGDRFNTVLFGSFAGVALVLAAIGIYGVMSFVVAQRTHEIGLRMALGAGRGRVLGEVLREGMTTAALGTAAGALGAYAIARAMEGLVYGVEGWQAPVFAAVALTLLAAALVACYVPARRAAAVDPMVALREE